MVFDQNNERSPRMGFWPIRPSRFAIALWLVAVWLTGSFAVGGGKDSTYHMEVIKSEFRLDLYKGEKKVKSFRVAVGKNAGDKEKRGDNRTPEGDFFVAMVQDARSWGHDFRDGKGYIKGAYGPWFIRLYTGADGTRSGKAWTGIGIHGTHDSTSIGKRATEGCIRLLNRDLLELRKHVDVDMNVRISP